MNVNKTLIALSLLAAATTAHAAPSVDFTVEAVIPDRDFYVTPVNGWNATPLKMSWNEASGALDTINQQLKLKNSNGGIKAYLNGQPALTSSESDSVIELQVKIAGKDLPLTSANAVTLYDADAASVEKTAGIAVSQKNPAGARPGAGLYMGAVTMMFDSIPPSGR